VNPAIANTFKYFIIRLLKIIRYDSRDRGHGRDGHHPNDAYALRGIQPNSLIQPLMQISVTLSILLFAFSW